MNENDDQFISKIDRMSSPKALRNNSHFYTKNDDAVDYTIKINNPQDLSEEPFLSTKNNYDEAVIHGNIFLLGESKNYKI